MNQRARDKSGAVSDWQPTASGDAQLTLSALPAGLQMDFDFKGGGGFVVARRAMARSVPEDYALRFRLRGRGAANDLELKLVDPTGQNVWRHTIKGLQPTARWKRMTLQSRDFEFAWGPAGGASLRQLGFIEIAVVASAGGAGRLGIADLEIEDLSPREAPTATASSALPSFGASQALSGAGWRPRADDARPWIMIDLRQARVFGGLIIDWRGAAPASGFRIRGSVSGRRFKDLYTAAAAGGPRNYVYLPAANCRYLRVELHEPSPGLGLRLQSFEFSRSIDAFWRNVAGAEARGWHPRWLHQEQSLWTPSGTSHGRYCMLMNEDGMVEVSLGSFSIEPMLRIEGRLLTWTEVTSRQELLHGWMPVPSVIWETADLRLRIRAEATVSGALRVIYALENLAERACTPELFVLVRPFQVTPPWQRFRALGGISRIHDLCWRDAALLVNGSTRIIASPQPAGFAALRFDEGFMAASLSAGTLPGGTETHDPFGFATGVLRFEVPLQAHQMREIVLCSADAATALGFDEPAFDWGAKQSVTQLSGSGWLGDAIRAQLTATAHILVTRSGAALQPGPRRYTRSWIRDGAMMSAALLRMGHADEVREFIRWYAPYQRADGFVPCCVDSDGPDWLVEHDSHGQLLALIADHYRFTQDRAQLVESWIHVERAVGCISRLLEPDGLMPISVSHEGYLAQAVHAYWDDFWTLRGLRDAEYLANALGQDGTALLCRTLGARVAAGLFASIAATQSRRGLDFVPGSAEWADFDPTATANALALLDIPEGLDRAALERTFDKYLADWHRKRSGAVDSSNYTPYEIRIIPALLRLGRRDAALELLRFFLSDRRPPPWNQWPEIAWRDHKAPAHMGDLPHTWIAAEYVLAVRSLFVYEREADQSLVLAAGLAPEWIEGSGVQVRDLPTPHGLLSYSLTRVDAATLRCEIGGGVAAKIVLRPPLGAPLLGVSIDGSPSASFDRDSVTVLRTPALVVCTLVPKQAAPRISIAGHTARFSAGGQLEPWTSWTRALGLEMSFYRQCPLEHGYPRFVCATFLDRDWAPYPGRDDSIPATQNGMGIISYLKFGERCASADTGYLTTARAMGDYLIKESLTPPSGKYPLFTRSTGKRDQFPQPPDSGSQGDRPYEIEPDKGGIAGYALLRLFEATGANEYWQQALQNAAVLAANQQAGDASHSPWPFRADYRDGAPRGEISGNMSYILRLYDALIEHGRAEFAGPRRSLWEWIKRHQIPSAAADGALFAQFFEDHETPTNRSAWAPLNLARYLLEREAQLGPDWRADAGTLIDFVRRNFTHQEFGITVCHEQDEDKNPWGGINSTYGAVLALYAKAMGSEALAGEARQALNFTLYCIDEQGRPRDWHQNPVPGGWQEDAHTDVIHNFMDALRAFPQWGDAGPADTRESGHVRQP